MNWYGNETLHATPFANITINGTAVAAVQNVDNFSFACVFARAPPCLTPPDSSSTTRLRSRLQAGVCGRTRSGEAGGAHVRV